MIQIISAEKGAGLHAYLDDREEQQKMNEDMKAKRQEELRRERIDAVSLETALAIIRNCMTLMRAGELRESVSLVIENLVEISGARNASILLVDDENRKAIKYSECISASVDMSKMPGDGFIPYEVVKAWQMMLTDRNSIIISNDEEREESARRSPALAAMIERNGMRSVCMLPLRHGEEIFGFMYVVNFDTDRLKDTKDLLELMSFFIGTEIFNDRLKAELRRMSVTDELTGLNNRHAMMDRVEAIISGPGEDTVGIINMDLNGLKLINDHRGHEGGDLYLKHAADVMRGIFESGDLYRAGGDEFIAIVEGRTYEEFSELINLLRDMEDRDPEFNLAIGYYWSDKGMEDSKTAFMNADRSMYMDKRRYYSSHPEEDRRKH